MKYDSKAIALQAGEPKRTRWRLLALPIILVILAFSSPVVRDWVQIWRAESAFNNRTSSEKFIGKTASKVIEVLGQPNDEAVDSNGDRDLIYVQYHGERVCRFEVRKGVVTNVVHWTK